MTVVKKRILVGGMSNNKGGTEAAIANIVGVLNSRYIFDFISNDDLRERKDVLTSESHVYYAPERHSHPIARDKTLKDIMREHAEEYCAVWANYCSLSNIDVLMASKKYGIKKRILHMHAPKGIGSPHQRLLSMVNGLRLNGVATDYWVCSDGVGQEYFGNGFYRVIPNVVNSGKFRFSESSRSQIRMTYGVEDRNVVGTVGRLDKEKNHMFLIERLADAVKRGSDAVLMIVGEGARRGDLLERAESLGVADRVIITGAQGDVAQYLSAFDVFAFPSILEGLGIALIEAQFNGLKCYVSTSVPRETQISDQVRYISLDSEEEWLEMFRQPRYSYSAKLNKKADLFDLDRQRQNLLGLFEGDQSC